MKILFQGDSITDAGRNREDPHDMGPGYPGYAADFIKEEHPDVDFEFVNLGHKILNLSFITFSSRVKQIREVRVRFGKHPLTTVGRIKFPKRFEKQPVHPLRRDNDITLKQSDEKAALEIAIRHPHPNRCASKLAANRDIVYASFHKVHPP